MSKGTIESMKAIRIHHFGGPELLIYEEVSRPVPGPGEVLIRVYAAGVNPGDWKLRKGKSLPVKIPLPVIPGWDVSGIVEDVGQGVTAFQEGDAVYGLVPFHRFSGGLMRNISQHLQHIWRTNL